MKKVLNLLAGLALVAYVCAPVYAFTPLQSPILSTAAVTPNVMVMIDNSGSMDSIIWHEGYDDSASYPAAYYCRANNRNGCTDWREISAGTTYYPSSVVRGSCSSTERLFYYGRDRCMAMPDPVGDNQTRFDGNYLRYLLSQNIANANIPTDYRMSVARTVTKNIVSQNLGLRYGLFSFNTSSTQAGGSLLRDVKNFSQSFRPDGTLEVTSAQAAVNYNAFVTAVDSLSSKTWTPLAEAYYEVTRYFRGMSRYQGSGSGDYTSPIQYRCQRNFGIVVTDGLPTYDRTFPNNDPLRDNPKVTGSNNLPNWDGVNNDGNNVNGDGEGDALYLDDIAQFAYDVDLRDTTANDNAGKSFNDSAFLKQNLMTYTVGFAVNNDMLRDAATHAGGSYYTASNADQLNRSLSSAINEIASKAGSGGAGASSSASLTTETYYYKTLYDPKDWRGTIEAYRLDPATGRAGDRPNWSTDATILSSNNTARYETYSNNNVVALSYSNLTQAQKNILDASVTAPLKGADLIEWSRGVAVSGLRSRQVLLGDIINSSLERLSPQDKLASSLAGESSYDAYLAVKADKIKGMTSSLLVNSNDGLFHVINAATGAHRYAYMPSTLISSLKIIANSTYATGGSHRFMVDGQIAVADLQLGATWATMAFSGMGAGGKSMFAIKLFDAASDVVSAKWEVSAPDTSDSNNKWNDLGYTYSKPVIARNKDNKWVAIFGNGYGSFDGKAALFVVDAATGELLKKITVDDNKVGSAGYSATGNGLSSPQVVVDAENKVQAVYAGDLRGNLWKISLDDDSSRKLFAAGDGHPFSATPLVVEKPSTSGVGSDQGYLVLIGTGKLNESSDKLDKSRQAFYAIWDNPSQKTTVKESELLRQSINGELQINGETYFTTSESKIDWTSKRGWYLPLIYNNQEQGERVIYPAQTTLGRVIFVTAKVDANDPCESSGSGRLVELDLVSGAMLEYPVLDTNGDSRVNDDDRKVGGLNIGGGLPGLPVIIDKGANKPTQTKIILLSNGKAKFVDEKARQTGISRRIMWRQLQ
ncbi:pilus assembly protein [Pseudomonas tohonis]|uniref:pilus assembly protein n=1 Tax=Pseudomonas tohonis TaxID=2725477 RepID=UPI001F3C1958|nr:PilC/PilY family type IV pilus protein [Pseudomonas tohonis]